MRFPETLDNVKVEIRGSGQIVFLGENNDTLYYKGNGGTTSNADHTGNIKTIEVRGGSNHTSQLFYVKFQNKFLMQGEAFTEPISGTVASLNGTTVTLTDEVSGWVNGEDVVGPQKTNIRSMSQEEMAEQKAKFFTYENRRDVHQGQQAMAERLEIARQLQAAGVDPPAINELFGGTES